MYNSNRAGKQYGGEWIFYRLVSDYWILHVSVVVPILVGVYDELRYDKILWMLLYPDINSLNYVLLVYIFNCSISISVARVYSVYNSVIFLTYYELLAIMNHMATVFVFTWKQSLFSHNNNIVCVCVCKNFKFH